MKTGKTGKTGKIWKTGKTGKLLISNNDRLAWLLKRVNYLEHRDMDGAAMSAQLAGKGFWLSNVVEDNWTEFQDCLTRPDCCELSIVEYIDLMIQREVLTELARSVRAERVRARSAR